MGAGLTRDTQIAKKADKAEMAGALALKADRGAVETELAAKPSVRTPSLPALERIRVVLT